jgi:uncharacterized membrane protein
MADDKKRVVNKLQELFYYFVVTSFVGYIYEFLLITFYYKSQFVNQGPLHGPWLFIYGIGGVVVIYALRTVVHRKVRLGKLNIMPVIIALMILLIVAVVEYIGHYILDVFFNLKPWDYSEKFMNINGRICLEDSLRFVVLGMIGMYGIVPLLDRVFSKITKRQNVIMLLIIVVMFVIDIIYSFIIK